MDQDAKLTKKARSKTGCRTCRIRKVKCDEEKIPTVGQDEPQCRRCLAARIRCEWRGGPIPRRSRTPKASGLAGAGQGQGRAMAAECSIIAPTNNKRIDSNSGNNSVLDLRSRHRTIGIDARFGLNSPYSARPLLSTSGTSIQAANSLSLSAFDRSCLGYLQDSGLVVVLGKHWPWSTISYAYQKIAVKEPMLMSMILASTASEINRKRLHDQDLTLGLGSRHGLPNPSNVSDAHVDGQVHYGRALSGLREALMDEVKTPEKIEAILITLWLLIDYENRFGSGASAINIHIRGIKSLLQNHVVPSLKGDEISPPRVIAPATTPAKAAESMPTTPSDISHAPSHSQFVSLAEDGGSSLTSVTTEKRLRSTAVPLFLLWTLYLFSPGYLFWSPDITRVDSSLFRTFLHPDSDEMGGGLGLQDLYKISRQSPSRFWGETYPATAQLDDLDNLPGLALYHKCHVLQFKITELARQSPSCFNPFENNDRSLLQQIVDQIVAIADEYDLLLSTAKSAPSCDIVGPGRRVMETNFWASITYYSTIVYLYLCFREALSPHQTPDQQQQHHHHHQNQNQNQSHYQSQYPCSSILPLEDAVSLVLELSLKLYRSRPHLTLRIPWQLFMAGIATSDKIYQDWVSIRLRELGRYGRNFTRLSARFDEIIQGSDPFAYNPRHFLPGE